MAALDKRIAGMRNVVNLHPKNFSFKRQLDNLLLEQRHRDQDTLSLVPLKPSKNPITSLQDGLSKAVIRQAEEEANLANHTRMHEQYSRQAREATLNGDFKRLKDLHDAIVRRLEKQATANSKLEETRRLVANLTHKLSTSTKTNSPKSRPAKDKLDRLANAAKTRTMKKKRILSLKDPNSRSLRSRKRRRVSNLEVDSRDNEDESDSMEDSGVGSEYNDDELDSMGDLDVDSESTDDDEPDLIGEAHSPMTLRSGKRLYVANSD
ncbi:MAG: hypothetical protein Q9195_004252 [Heterodermia aff. obscurata]